MRFGSSTDVERAYALLNRQMLFDSQIEVEVLAIEENDDLDQTAQLPKYKKY